MAMDLTLILTEDCNLRCAYCYQKNFRRNHMSAEVGMAAVRAAIERCGPSLALTAASTLARPTASRAAEAGWPMRPGRIVVGD